MFISSTNGPVVGVVSRPHPQPAATQAATTPVVAVPAAPAPAAAPNPEDVRHAIEKIQAAVQMAQSLHFSVDKGTGRTIVKVMDTTTQEVIRQIPTEEVITISHALDRMTGLLFKGKA